MKNFRFPRFSNRFDAIRLVLASLVILSHTPELMDGNRHRELLTSLFHTISFGDLGVDGFFVISGYLIVQSWVHAPQLLPFLQKRVLRIYPAFIVASLLCLLVFAPLAGNASYWHDLHLVLALKNLLRLQPPVVPPIFAANHSHVINGAMWTIYYEFECYLMVAILGVLSGSRLKSVWTGCAFVFVAYYFFFPHLLPLLARHVQYIPALFLERRFPALYGIGGLLYLWRDKLPRSPVAYAIAGLALFSGMYSNQLVEMTFAVFGGFLLTTWAQKPASGAGLPDVSYGTYLYGWPVIQFVLSWGISSLWVATPLSLLLSLVLGWFSWELVEKPCLRAKNYDRHWKFLSRALGRVPA